MPIPLFKSVSIVKYAVYIDIHTHTHTHTPLYTVLFPLKPSLIFSPPVLKLMPQEAV